MPSSKTRMDLSKATVLVVEDSPPALEILSQILMGFGVKQATKTASFEEAAQFATTRKFDLALVDDGAFSEAGLGVVAALRSDPRGANYTIPIIVLGASISEARARKARDAGANFLVAKPVAPAILLDRIEWIARHTRPFVTSDTYRGPDRRFKTAALPDGQEERRADTLRLMAAPERALAQDEIDSLFG